MTTKDGLRQGLLELMERWRRTTKGCLRDEGDIPSSDYNFSSDERPRKDVADCTADSSSSLSSVPESSKDGKHIRLSRRKYSTEPQ